MNKKGKIDLNGIEFKRELPFTVPEGYFDELPGRIQSKCSKSEVPPSKWGKFVALRSQLAFAAGFAFMVVAAYFGYYLARPLSNQTEVPHRTDYVEIVDRSISDYDDVDLYRAIEKKKKQDSINQASREMYQRLYIRSNNCITIIGEKKEVKP